MHAHVPCYGRLHVPPPCKDSRSHSRCSPAPPGQNGIEFDCSEAERLLWQFVAERSSWGPSLRTALRALDNGRPWQALVRYLLLAEQGCEIAAANAAFMLQMGQGARGGRVLELAVQLLHRWVGEWVSLEFVVCSPTPLFITEEGG